MKKKQSKTQWRSHSQKLSAHNNTLCSTENGFRMHCNFPQHQTFITPPRRKEWCVVVWCGVVWRWGWRCGGAPRDRKRVTCGWAFVGFCLFFSWKSLLAIPLRAWKRIDQAQVGFGGTLRAAQSENSVLSGSSLRSFGFLGATCKSAERRPSRQCRWRVSTTTTGRRSRSASALAITESRHSSQGSQDTFSADVTRDRGVPDMRTPTSRKHRENRQYLFENLGCH